MCLSVYIKVCFVKVSTFHTCYPPPFLLLLLLVVDIRVSENFHTVAATHRREVTDDRRDSPSFYTLTCCPCVFWGWTDLGKCRTFQKKRRKPFRFFFRFFLFDDLRLYTAVIFLNFVPTAHDVSTFSFYLFNLIY